MYCTSPKSICAMGSSTVHFQSLGVLNPSSKGLKQPMMSRFQSSDGWTNTYIYMDMSTTTHQKYGNMFEHPIFHLLHDDSIIIYIWYQFYNYNHGTFFICVHLAGFTPASSLVSFRRPLRVLQTRDDQLRRHGHFAAEVLPRRVGRWVGFNGTRDDL